MHAHTRTPKIGTQGQTQTLDAPPSPHCGLPPLQEREAAKLGRVGSLIATRHRYAEVLRVR